MCYSPTCRQRQQLVRSENAPAAPVRVQHAENKEEKVKEKEREREKD
jgi:hypothetical protein